MGVTKSITTKKNTRKDSPAGAENGRQKEVSMVNTDATDAPDMGTGSSTTLRESEGTTERPAPTTSDQPTSMITQPLVNISEKVLQHKQGEHQKIDAAVQKYKRDLTCVQCLETETLAKNGVTRFNGKVLKCNNCHKQTTGKAVLALLDHQIGSQWRMELDTQEIPTVARVDGKRVNQAQATPHDENGGHGNHEPSAETQVFGAERDTQCQGAAPETSGFIRIPAHIWENTLQTIKSLTSQTQQLLQSQQSLTSALEQANNRIRRLENEIAIDCHKKDTCAPQPRVAEQGSDPMPVDTHLPKPVLDATSTPTPIVGPVSTPTSQQGGHNKDTNYRQLNWAEIAKQSLRRTNVIPGPLEQRIRKTIRLLDSNKSRVVREPIPMAVYFKNVRRGPIGTLRSALWESLPSWALLSIGFVGGSVLEIITDTRLKARLVATLKIMGIEELAKFDVLQGGIRKVVPGSAVTNRFKSNLQATIRRLSAYVQENRCAYAAKWYSTTLADAKLRLANYEKNSTPVSTQHTQNSEMDIQKTDTEKRKENVAPRTSAVTDDEGWTTVGERRETAVRVEPELLSNDDTNTSQDRSVGPDHQPDVNVQQSEKELGQSNEITPEIQ